MSSQICAAVTYNARCGRSLLQLLQRRRHEPSSPNPILLFALAPSSTTPPEVLSDITSTLTKLYPEHVGCISAPLPSQHFDSSTQNRAHSCSLAYALVNGVSFHSAISGHAEAQVGRWHAARQRTAEDANGAVRVSIENPQIRIIGGLSGGGKVDWEAVWDRTANSVISSSSNGNGLDLETLPDTLRNLDPSAVQNVLYFSDKAPEGLATALEGAFPQANKLSLVASSTPFITGRPVTLFHNGSILSSGAVGIAFTSSFPSPPPVVELSFPPLVRLSTNLSVTSSEGNVILSLDSKNPVRLLLSAIQKHGLASLHTSWMGREDEFYVGVIDPSSQQLSQLHRINAGEPSRGAIALDASSAPRGGTIVRLYHLPRDPVPGTLKYVPDTVSSNSVSLYASPEMNPAASFGNDAADDPAADSDCLVVPNAFLAASENGFTLSRGMQRPWKCVVPGAPPGARGGRGYAMKAARESFSGGKTWDLIAGGIVAGISMSSESLEGVSSVLGHVLEHGQWVGVQVKKNKPT